MALSPDPGNYTLGKGVIYFDPIVSDVKQGERDLGNAQSFSFNVSLEKLEHFSSRSGLKSKDKEVISQLSPAVNFTLDEINADNMGMLTLASASDITTTAANVFSDHDGVEAATVAAPIALDNRVELADRGVGATRLTHGTVTSGPFVVGETVTGGTSTATGLIAAVGTGWIDVVGTTGGPWQAELLTGGTSSATATSDNAAGAFQAGVILVEDSAQSTQYVAGTDYNCSTTLKDDIIGRIQVLSTGSITTAESLRVSYDTQVTTAYSTIKAFNSSSLEGQLRFVSDNALGDNQELTIWRVSLTPDGDTALIGDDWSTLSFVGEVLKDEVGHASNPYMEIIV